MKFLWRIPLLLSIGGLFLAVDVAAGPRDEPVPVPRAPDRPRLAVLVVFDQMRGDYLARWKDLFADGGFRRLQTQGVWFSQCHYPYAHTVTAAGHASMLTGCSPDEHGVIGNEWYDVAAGGTVGCVETMRYPIVTGPVPMGKPASNKEGASPERLLVQGLGDSLKEITANRAKVVGLSLKDRSAILPTGHHADACYWFDIATGQVVTSTYYRDRLHPWAEAFNRDHVVDQWLGKIWERLRPDLDYTRRSGPDDVPGEGSGSSQGRVFPHPLGAPATSPNRGYYGAVYNSPFGNDALLALAKRAVEAEHLGQGPVPDLLTISFSSNDSVGHCWGPDSQEVLDVTLRSDLLMADLLRFLDDHVGKGRYVLAVTADHGICPLPEVSRARGIAAGRLALADLRQQAAALLSTKFGAGTAAKWFDGPADLAWYLNRRLLQDRHLESATVEQAVADWLRKQDGIEAVYTRSQLSQGLPSTDAIGQAVKHSFHPARSGDLFLVLKPYWLPSSVLSTGTTHGSPHAYDTHVPLLIYGPGVTPGERTDRVTPQAAAAILAHALGIPPPACARAPVPAGLFQ